MFNNNASAELIQRDNFLICTGSTPQHSCDVFHGVSNEPPRQLISKVLGDVAAAGQSSTVNLVNISDDVASALAFFALRNLWAQLELPISWTFPVLATVVLPVALLFRPPETKL